MAKYYVLYNPLSSNNRGYEKAREFCCALVGEELIYSDVTKISDLDSFVKSVPETENIIICGGDGTLHRFINSTDTDNIKCNVYCCASGSGNDFIRDIGKYKEKSPVLITQYLRNLPVVTVKGNTYKFLNNASFGLDGYCCEEADAQRQKKGKSSNYTLIALKGLFFKYKPRNATIIVDGVQREYKDVWLAPTMNGRYLGGGLMVAPAQDRLNEEHTVSVVLMHDIGKLRALTILPSLYKGEHIKNTDVIEVLTGKDIKITYEMPAPMQIDGETIKDVLSCEVRAV